MSRMTIPGWRGAVAAGLALSVVAGCTSPGPFLRTNAIPTDTPRVITTDAKLRNVFMVPPGTGDSNHWRVCAEASPDVFSALSASTAASLGGSQSASATEANARLAVAVAEAAGTIERTQTVNLLRESMYRTCERYLSGAISREAFVVQAGRDWRGMIAVLAIEQLTRTARAPATIIVPPSTSAVITEPTEFAAELRRAATATASARIVQSRANAAFDAAGCQAASPPPVATEDPAITTKRQTCQGLSQAKTEAADEVTRAAAAETALSNAYSRMPAGGAPGVNSSTGNPQAPGGQQPQEGQRSASDLAAVGDNVQAIVEMAFRTNEMELFCVQVLAGDFRGMEVNSRRDLERACTTYALRRVSLAAGIDPGWQQRLENSLDQLRAYLGTNASVAQTRWMQLLDDAGLADSPNTVFRNAATVEQMLTAVDQAFDNDRSRIIEAMTRRRGQ